MKVHTSFFLFESIFEYNITKITGENIKNACLPAVLFLSVDSVL